MEHKGTKTQRIRQSSALKDSPVFAKNFVSLCLCVQFKKSIKKRTSCLSVFVFS